MKKKIKIKYILFLILGLAIGFSAYFGAKSFAADEIYIDIDGARVDPNVSVQMRQKILQLNMKTTGVAYDNTDLYQVDWSIMNQDAANPVASVTRSSGSQTIGLVTALSPGTVTVTVIVRDKTNIQGGTYAEIASTTCKIDVIFAVDTTVDDSMFKYVNETDTMRSLVVYSNHGPIQLTLNFGDATNTQWTIQNEEVATIGLRTGIVNPVGAGHTVITATYKPEGSTQQETSTLNVYIIPRITEKETEYSAGTFNKSLDVGLDRGDYLYLDTYFGDNNTETVGDKVVWVIKQDQGDSNRVPIANSLPTTNDNSLRSDLIEINPLNSSSSILDVQAKAGVYYVEFYTAGTYNGEDEKTTCYTPTVVKLTVYANFGDYDVTMQVGDSLSLANKFNLTYSDFLDYFATPSFTYDGNAAIPNYVQYVPSLTEVNAERSGKIATKITAINTTMVRRLTNPDSEFYGNIVFTINLNILDTFALDRQSLIISVGQSFQLTPLFSNSQVGTPTWYTSDSKYVTVNQSGLIYGVKATTGIADITITAKIPDSADSSLIKEATCLVKVEPTVEDFKLSPASLQMKVGDNATIKAEIKQSVSTAPLLWKSKDTSIVTIEPAADNKSAVITAKKGGATTITVTNTVNGEQHYVEVTVLIPISSMSFTEPVITVKRMYNERSVKVQFLPTAANMTDIIWYSSDTSVATIADAGGSGNERNAMVQLIKPGIVTLTASPVYNPFSVMATCTMTVIEAASDIKLVPSEMTLNAAYGDRPAESQTILYTLEPEGCTTNVTWVSGDDKVATVDNTGKVTAKKAGTTYITAKTEEGLLKQCKVTVKQPCASISFSPAEVKIESDSTYNAKDTLRLSPADTTDTYTWKAYDTKVATVDSKGVITGVKSGETFVIATSSTGPLAILKVYVRDKVKGVNLNFDTRVIQKGQQFTLTPIFTPESAFNKEVTWTSSNPAIASVKDGLVRGLKGGSVVIRCVTSDGGYSASCLVTVTEITSTVTLNETKHYLPVGSSFTLSAVVKNESATNKNVSWSSSNKKVATVNKNGRVKGIKIGKTYIKAKAADGSGAFARCHVYVVRRASRVKLNKYAAKMVVGSVLTLKATVLPKNATIRSVTWSSSNNEIATVDSTGRVQALSAGLVKIRAKARDGSGKAAICFISVVEKVESTGVTVTQSELVIAKGTKMQSGITIAPRTSTDKIKYYSDDPTVASIDSRGKIKAKRIGQATVYGETSNGQVGYMDVTVVGINRKSIGLRQYDTETLWVNGITTDVRWYTTNRLIATVDSTGKLVGRRPGYTKVYAVVKGVKMKCLVRVKRIR